MDFCKTKAAGPVPAAFVFEKYERMTKKWQITFVFWLNFKEKLKYIPKTFGKNLNVTKIP